MFYPFRIILYLFLKVEEFLGREENEEKKNENKIIIL